MSEKPKVVLGLLGPSLDSGRQAERWEKWRPSVALCQYDDLVIDRFELLYERKFTKLCRTVVDDISTVSPETKVRPHELSFDDAWDFEAVYSALLDFARAYPFKPDEEDYLVHITTGSHVAQICLFILTESRYLPARLIQSVPPSKKRGEIGLAGSFDIVDLDLSRYDRLAARFGAEQRESTSFLKSGIETRNKPFNLLIDQIEQVSVGSKAPILLTGPTGSGKSQLAKRIYELKKNRRQLTGRFVDVNCSTVRGDGAMSTLFGHVRGAFTGAVGDRPGLLRAADGGLLFLDEVGELGLDEQAMLLMAVEERRFLPVGSDKEVKSDFQLIAGTNRDLQSAVASGRFREDLLARINLWTFKLPALGDRSEDIEPNLDYELEQFAKIHGTKATFNKEARSRFLSFAVGDAAWSGNFRDLNAAVIRMATFSAGGRIGVDLVDAEIDRLRASWSVTRPSAATNLEDICDTEALAKIDPFDRVQLAEVARVCRVSRSLSEAGRSLFAVSRLTKSATNDADRLKKYLARFHLSWAKVIGKDND